MQTADFESAVNHHRAGRVLEAAGICENLLNEQPHHEQACFLLGVIALQLDQPDAAIAPLLRATEVQPDNAIYHANLGEALRRAGRFEDAAGELCESLMLAPTLVEPMFNLGLLLRNTGRWEAAVSCFEKLALDYPGVEEFAHELRATHAGAQSAIRQGLDVSPQLTPDKMSAMAFVILGKLEHARKNHVAALAECERALELDRACLPALVYQAEVLFELGRYNRSMARLQTALDIAPGDRELLRRRAVGLRSARRLREALMAIRQLIAVADQSEYHSLLLSTLPYVPGHDRQTVLAESRTWESTHARAVLPRNRKFANDETSNRRLRVGYVSSNFVEHVGKYFLDPLFANRTQEEFELFLYSCTRAPADDQTIRLRGLTDWWRDAGALDDDQLAALIVRDRIDILVDLDMHTDDNRLLLFARKPAPIQLCWLAYAGTTGLSAIDYRISDPYLEPTGGATDCYAERTLCLPNCFWCYDPLTQKPDVNALPALTAKAVRYGSLNHYLKVNDSVIAVWASVLKAVTNSTLLLFAPEGDIRDDTLIAFDRHGVNATHIEFVKRLSRNEYLATYNEIDICLDTFPYNGGATSLDAFWMGVPVVTLKGDVPMGRAGYSIAMNLGLGELVADTNDEYVQIAEGLGTDLNKLARLRGELRQRMHSSPLMDGPKFARDMERLQREIWQQWCCARPMTPGLEPPFYNRCATSGSEL